MIFYISLVVIRLSPNETSGSVKRAGPGFLGNCWVIVRRAHRRAGREGEGEERWWYDEGPVKWDFKLSAMPKRHPRDLKPLLPKEREEGGERGGGDGSPRVWRAELLTVKNGTTQGEN